MRISVLKKLVPMMLATLLVAAVAGNAQGMMGGGGPGPGMMGGYGSNGGSGMMGGDYNGMMGAFFGPQANSPQSLGIQRLTVQDVKTNVGEYLKTRGNSNLVMDEVMEFDRNFYVLVKEKDTGKAAFELLVNPYNGAVGPEPGPDMMWNAKYSPMSWRVNNQAAMTVTVAKARELAQKYLDGIGQGYSVEEKPDEFYGYYTAHVLKDGKTVGMLSVNGTGGQVWFHSWHGAFRGTE